MQSMEGKMGEENTDEDGWIELFAHPVQNTWTKKNLLQGQELQEEIQ